MGTMTTGWTYGFIKPESLDKVIAQSKEFLAEVLLEEDHDQEQYTAGYEIDDHILDINIWDGDILDSDGMWHCESIECHTNENGEHVRGYKSEHLWSIKKEEANAHQ